MSRYDKKLLQIYVHLMLSIQNLTCMTLIFRPVSCASCSRMCLVGLGVAAKADLRTSNCLALIVVRGPLLLAPTPEPLVFSLEPSPLTDSESASSRSLTPSSPSLLLLLVEVLFLLFVSDRLLFGSCLTSGDSKSIPGRPNSVHTGRSKFAIGGAEGGVSEFVIGVICDQRMRVIMVVKTILIDWGWQILSL